MQTVDDSAALQGTWKVVGLELNGVVMDEDKLPPNARVTVTGDMFESTGMGAAYRGRMALHGHDNRKTFSITFQEGPEKGNVNNALFELDGDTWTICLDMKGGPAPAALVSTPSNGYALEILQRMK